MTARALSKLNLSKAKLLLVGESELSMDILSQILLGFGVNHTHRCGSAQDGLAAAAVAAYDLILIDQDMEQMSGADMCRDLRSDTQAKNYTSPVLVLSALTSVETVATARDAGAHFVLAKPIVPAVLLERIEWIARSEREFVTSEGYRGPDRRFQQSPLPPGLEERRNETLKMMAAPERALDQSEIDSPVWLSKSMSVVRIFKPENTLFDVVGGPDDPTVASLARDAETRVMALRSQIRAHVAEQHAILARHADKPEEEVFAECYAIAKAARAISDVAGAADMEFIGEAARGIFALIRALGSKGVWHTDALKLHIDTLALFNSDGPPTRTEAIQILKRLQSMRDWIGVPD